jgi:hypothetical protein
MQSSKHIKKRQRNDDALKGHHLALHENDAKY